MESPYGYVRHYTHQSHHAEGEGGSRHYTHAEAQMFCVWRRRLLAVLFSQCEMKAANDWLGLNVRNHW